MAFQDNVRFHDGVTAGLESSAKPPVVPCKKCGAETKPHHPVVDGDGKIIERRRICSNRVCRRVIEIA